MVKSYSLSAESSDETFRSLAAPTTPTGLSWFASRYPLALRALSRLPGLLLDMLGLNPQRHDMAQEEQPESPRPAAPTHADVGPLAAVNFGVLLAQRHDFEGARAAFQYALHSGHPRAAALAARNLEALSRPPKPKDSKDS